MTGASMKVLTTALVMLSATFLPGTEALARCELGGRATNSDGSCQHSGGNSSGRSSNGNAKAAAALALGAALLQGLQESNSVEDVQRELDADHREYQQKMRNAEKRAANVERSATGAAGTNPWSKPTKADSKSSSSGGRAPYADASCANFVQKSKAKIDWDFVNIKNKCGFPIQVLMCYYMQGEESKCNKPKVGWGTTSTIPPGGETVSLATTRSWPYRIKHIVCNMAGVKNHSHLCLRPGQ